MNPILHKHKEIYSLINDNQLINKDYPPKITTEDLRCNEHYSFSIKQIIIINSAIASILLSISMWSNLKLFAIPTILFLCISLFIYMINSKIIYISEMNENTKEFIDFLNNYKTIYCYLNQNFNNFDLIKNMYPPHEFQTNQSLTFDFIIKYLFSNKDKEHIFQTVLSPEQYKKNKIRTNELTDNSISIFNIANIYNQFDLKNLDLIHKAIKLDIEFKQLGLPNNVETYTKFIKSRIDKEINKEDFYYILRMKFHNTHIDIHTKINFDDLHFLNLSEQMHIIKLFNEFMNKTDDNQILILNKTFDELSCLTNQIKQITTLNPYLDKNSLYKELKNEIMKIKQSNNIINLLTELIDIQQQVLNQLTNNVIHSKSNIHYLHDYVKI